MKPYLHERFGVSELGVFGSWIRGEESADSDVDVLVDFDRPLGLFELMELEDFLETQLQRKVDVAVRRSLRKYIGRYILAEVEYI
ncbi:MAG: nucleotidyltransferase family protein [Saprospiraceae bacterium]|nr:nucleotidyltransferase family protein [Saprospiraceae bacterium]